MADPDECTSWGPPGVVEEEILPAGPTAPLLSSEEKSAEDPLLDHEAGKKQTAPEERRSLIISFIMLLVSIPALIGAWCWPALVVGLISGTVSAAARKLGHDISFGVTAALMVFVILYLWWGSRKRGGSRWQKYGPLYVCIAATPLILADLVRHILQDTGVWKECQRPAGEIWSSDCTWSSSQYHCTEAAPHGCIPTKEENLTNLSMIGWLFTIFFTYFGFALLIVGTMWNANIIDKCKDVRRKWRQLRATE